MKRSLLFLLIAIATHLSAQDLSPVRIDFQSRIPTRDGVKLAAVIYQPTNMGKTTPALFALTPYGTDLLHNDAYWFAQRGYTVVTVDCRGRGNSEGSFIPFEFDGKDGFDICKWISKKEWYNGNIGMFGASYLGTVQWLVMREHPAGLKTIVPIASAAPGVDFPCNGWLWSRVELPMFAFSRMRHTGIVSMKPASVIMCRMRNCP